MPPQKPYDYTLDDVDVTDFHPDDVEVEQGPNVVGTAASKATTIGADRGWGESIRENLPTIGGAIGGITAAATGIAGLPALAAASVGAAAGKGYLDATRFVQSTDFNGTLNPYKWTSESPTPQKPIPTNLPVPTSVGQGALEAGEAGLMQGALPEAMGMGAGFGVRKLGNLAYRIGAQGRNAKYIEGLVNPQKAPIAPSGRNVGQPIQRFVAANKRGAEVPLQEDYSELLNGEFGKAKRLEVRDTGPQVTREGPVVTREDPTSFDMADESFDVSPESFEVGPTGPSIAEHHSARSEALKAGRVSGERDPQKVRGLMGDASQHMDEIKQIADENGLDPQRYVQLNDAYRQVQERYGNKFVRSLQNKTGGNLIDTLTNPKSWQTFKHTEGTGADRIRVSEDQPGLVQALKSAIGDESAWADLQTAVQKNILRKSTDAARGDINPDLLAKNIRNMLDSGAKDLVPANGELMKIAQFLAKHNDKSVSGLRGDEMMMYGLGSVLASAGQYPAAGMAAGVGGAMRGYRALSGMGTPDLARHAAQAAGFKGLGEKAAGVAGRVTGYAGNVAYTEDKNRTDRIRGRQK